MDKSKQKAIILCGMAIILFYWFMQHLALLADIVTYLLGIFFPFILGGAIAFILNVPMHQIEKHLFCSPKQEKYKKFRRPLAYVLTLLLLIVIIIAVFLVIVPEIGKTIADLVTRIPLAYDSVRREAEQLLASYPGIADQLSQFDFNTESFVQNITSFITNSTKGIINSGIGLVSNIVNGVTTFFVGFVFSIYVLFQKETLCRQGKKLLFAFSKKAHADKLISILKLTGQTFAAFISGQCLEAVILGSMFVVTMLILRLPYAWLTGVIIAMTALIPMVGAFIGCVVCALLILVVSPVKALIFVVMFLILQQIEGNLIYPHVVGKSVGLPGMWVLMAVMVGGSLFGVVGMIVFIPLFSVAYVLIKELTNRRLKDKQITIR